MKILFSLSLMWDIRAGANMSDIVERLKNWNHGIPKTMIVSEAIDEIEQLRRDLDHAKAVQEVWMRRARRAEAILSGSR